jgi:cytochrome c oxidase subunit 2
MATDFCSVRDCYFSIGFKGGYEMGSWSKYWFPPAISQLGHQVDSLFYLILVVTGIVFVLVESMLVIFVIRYRRRQKNAYGESFHSNTVLEILWTVVPAIVFLWLGISSVKLVYAEQTAPAKPFVIQAIGHQWYWEFKYPNGYDVFKTVNVPEGVPVEFEITSADVTHGFYIPNLRVQQDAVPGRYTFVQMDAITSGTFEIECNLFCGVNHSQMLSPMIVMPKVQFDSWMAQHPGTKA